MTSRTVAVMLVGRRLAALFALCLALVGCRVDTTVDVTVHDDGSGVVRVVVVLDADAAARGHITADAVPVDDLRAAGWTVAPVTTDADGSVTLQVDKPFASSGALPAVLAEVSVAFDQMRLERDRSFGELRWTLAGEVDFSGGATALGDDQLATLLGGQPLGRDLASLEHEIGSTVADATSLTLVAHMPGGETEQWTFRLGQAPTLISATGTVTGDGARIFGAVAIAAAGALLFVLLLVLLRRRSSRASRSGSGRRRHDAVVAPPKAADAPRVVGVEPAKKRLQLVVLATSGVLWNDDAESERWLTDLVVMQGGSTSREHVRAVLHEASLGRLHPADVWRALGASGDPAELDAAYLAQFQLAPGVVELVTTLARRGVGAACVSDDVAEWSMLLRRRFGLERFIRPWVLSSDVGARLPAPALFDAVFRQSGVAPSDCLMVDIDIDVLDEALDLGMSTVLLGPDPELARDRGHAHAADLSDLLDPRSRTPSRRP